MNIDPAEAYRSVLWRYAERMSDGRWEPYDYLKKIADTAQRTIEQGGGRLLVSVPPRHGKSELLSFWLPAWFLDWFPNKRIILASYADSLATDFGGRVKDELMQLNHWARPDGISKKRDDWKTSEGGGMRTVGVGGGITGRGGDLIIIDDPTKDWAEAQSAVKRKHVIDWFNATLYTRAEPNATIIVIQTRWHQGDLIGYLENDDSDKWETLRLPALAEQDDPLGRDKNEVLCPERFDKDAILKIKEKLGSLMFSGLYQQRPATSGGEIFKIDWVQTGVPGTIKKITMGVDLAISTKATADWTACAVVGQDDKGKIWLLDVQRTRATFGGVLEFIEKVAERWNPVVIAIEQVQYQAAVVQALMARGALPVKGVRPDKDKTTRAMPLAARYEAGNVVHSQNISKEFVEELVVFPNGEHDDMVDAAAYAFLALGKKQAALHSVPFRTASGSRWTQ